VLGKRRSSSGRPFQVEGPTTEKAQFCLVKVRAKGRWRRPWSDERRDREPIGQITLIIALYYEFAIIFICSHDRSFMWHGGQNTVTRHFWRSYLIVFYTASASKYFVQNQNILFLTEVMLVWLEQKNAQKFMICHKIIILDNLNFITLKLLWAIKSFIRYQIKQTALKSGYNCTTYAKFKNTRWIKELQTQ